MDYLNFDLFEFVETGLYCIYTLMYCIVSLYKGILYDVEISKYSNYPRFHLWGGKHLFNKSSSIVLPNSWLICLETSFVMYITEERCCHKVCFMYKKSDTIYTRDNHLPLNRKTMCIWFAKQNQRTDSDSFFSLKTKLHNLIINNIHNYTHDKMVSI